MSQESFFSKKIFIKNESQPSPYHASWKLQQSWLGKPSQLLSHSGKRDQIRDTSLHFPPPPTAALNFSDFVERNLYSFLPLQECPLMQPLSSLGKTYALRRAKSRSGKGFTVLPKVHICLVKFRRKSKWVPCLTSFDWIVSLGGLPIEYVCLSTHGNWPCDCRTMLMGIS